MKKTFTYLKHFSPLRAFSLLLLLSFVIFSCQTQSKEETEQKTDSSALANPAQPELNSDQSAVLQSIIGNQEDGIIRGITFGDDVAKIKATETAELFEDTADSLGYTFDTPQMESIDVQYFLNQEKKVARIKIEVYLNSKEATAQLWNAGKKHFTEIYAAPKEGSKTLIWNKNDVKVQMEDMTSGKDYGLKVTLYPTNNNVLAANQN